MDTSHDDTCSIIFAFVRTLIGIKRILSIDLNRLLLVGGSRIESK